MVIFHSYVSLPEGMSLVISGLALLISTYPTYNQRYSLLTIRGMSRIEIQGTCYHWEVPDAKMNVLCHIFGHI
jgi:hypothetical protein